MKRTTLIHNQIKLMAAGLAIWCFCMTFGCIRASDDTWIISEAPVPKDWPSATPVGNVEIKKYPLYRFARVTSGNKDQKAENSMFRLLFNHIKKHDIAMTAPVEMTYAETKNPQPVSMAFVYRDVTIGSPGEDDGVQVADEQPQSMLSIGVRGDYTPERFQENLKTLQTWLKKNSDAWRQDGPPRYLAYNSPFVPWFCKYGEVQIPLAPANAEPAEPAK